MNNVIQLPRSMHEGGNPVLNTRLGLLEKCLEELAARDKRISIRTSDGIELIKVSSIMHCQSDNNYTIINIEGGELFLVSKTLKYIHGLLPLKDFIRIHASHVVNTSHIKRINMTNGKYVIMQNGVTIPISKKYYQSVIQRF